MVKGLNNSSQGQWYPAPSMLSPRDGHMATLLGDGQHVLVAGGGNGNTTISSAEIYDGHTGSWHGLVQTAWLLRKKKRPA